jgi:hypothetical protein
MADTPDRGRVVTEVEKVMLEKHYVEAFLEKCRAKYGVILTRFEYLVR